MRIIAFLLFLLLCHYGFSQAYIPLPMTNAHWKMDQWMANGTCTCNSDNGLTTAGDTIIGTKTYVKLMGTWDNTICQNCGGWFPYPGYGSGYAGAIRQDTAGKKIYFVQSGTTEDVLYDFTQNVGDSVNSILNRNTGCPKAVIQSIDSVLLNTGYHKRFNLQNNGCLSGLPVSFIEGVGNTLGLLASLNNYEAGEELICLRQNNTTLYPLGTDTCSRVTGIKEFFAGTSNVKVYPNPSSNGLFTISNLGSGLVNIQVYNVLGMCILSEFAKENTSALDFSTQPKGIYFYRVTSESKIIGAGKLVME